MRTILVVADSPTETERLELLLTQADYRVHLAPNGGEGLARARRAPPDLIISDVTMPQMDGYELCRAVKSSERLRIAIATRRDREAERVCLEIADTGPGMPPEIIGRIFEPFFTTKPAGQGTGLELALCRGIVERHHGSICAKSAAGTGAVFMVELPLEEPPDAQPAAEVGKTAERIVSGSILVIDDEPGVSEVLADALAADGHTVDTVADGVAALERLRERAYDLILTDIRMPGLDGPDLYRELVRSRQELAQRVVFLTGDILSEDLRRALEELGRPTISKPLDFDELRSTVRRSLRS